MKLPHWIGIVLALIATLLALGPTVVPSLAPYAPIFSVIVAALVPVITGILGSLPSWFPKKNAGAAASTLLTVFCFAGVASLGAGCAAYNKDEPIVAADVSKAVMYGCAADALAAPVAAGTLGPLNPVTDVLAVIKAACPFIQATDTELATFAASFVSHPAAKAKALMPVDAGPVDAPAGG